MLAKKLDTLNTMRYNKRIVVIPSKWRHSGRGFDSRQVHHKAHWAGRKIHRWTLRLSVFYNGPAMVSTGW